MKSKIILLIFFLLFVFSVGSVFELRALKFTGILFFFFLPGYLISLILYKKINFLERFVYSVIISITIIISLTIWLNIFFQLEFNNFFLVILFFSLTIPLLIKVYTDKSIKINKFKIKLNKVSKIFLVYLVLSFLLRVFLFLRVGSILGADVGRFSSISHVYFLKRRITKNLNPYDLATGYFYFPGPLVLPLIFELLGINPIDSVTLTSFFFSFLSTLVYYLFAKMFLNPEKAVHAFFFYSLVFDVLLNYSIFGVFPYAFSILYFLVLCLILLKIFFHDEKRFFLLIISLLGLITFHLYLFFPLMAFLASIFTYEFVNENILFKKSTRIVIEILKASSIAFIFLLPWFFSFGRYIRIPNRKDNIVDLLTFAYNREKMSLDKKIWNMFFINPVGLMASSLFILGFLSFLILLKKFVKDKRSILVYFFIYLFVMNYMVFSDLNLSRSISLTWMVYPITFSYFLSNPLLNILLISIFYFVPSPSPMYLINILTPRTQPGIVPWVIWSEYSDVMNFIKENTSEDSIFLVDGGGSGCTGASSSYGERIFPLTSRRTFYFTDYCWAEYNKTEYRKRVDVYRRISINPDDSEALTSLKDYNVTYVYIGPNHIGLDPNLFLKSKNYELIYDESGFKIFKIE